MSIYRTAPPKPHSITLAQAMPIWPRWMRRLWWRLWGQTRAQERHVTRRLMRLVVSSDIMRAAYDMAVSSGGDVTVLPPPITGGPVETPKWDDGAYPSRSALGELTDYWDEYLEQVPMPPKPGTGRDVKM